ncbi:hypothetical protein CEE36_04635 [candidate division TA06 bacterium B3_TA06]|uniref:Secretion system C-terminal sorting domain-containing protein n=1 Tax=candidate division TA06 bacterium B3_TA06 TaxID=2012487 RepID=A0A532V7Z6_UNCT6|nr:MAG: hypothetical protein CEE36_04635 [candidate division TA06 bacterium B3_TA06]
MKRTSRIIIVASLLLVSVPLSAGWIHTYGGIGEDGGYWVEQTPDGGYIVAGHSMKGRWDYFYLVKTDSLGDTLWTRTPLSSGDGSERGARCVQQTSDGGYIVAGERAGWTAVLKTDENGDSLWWRIFTSMRPTLGTCVRETSDGGYVISGRYGLLKLDSAGDSVWMRLYEEKSRHLQLTHDGGYITTGQQYAGDKGWLVRLMRTDGDGDSLWACLYSLGEERPFAMGCCVQETSDGGYIISGETRRVGVPDSSKLFILKTDASGDSLWAHLYGSEGYNIGYSICQTPDGGYIITGVKELKQFTGGVWLLKTDEHGDTLWTRTFGNKAEDKGRCVQVTSDGGYVICGSTGSYCPWGRGTEVLLIKTDSLGYVSLEEEPVMESPIRLEASLNRLAYDVPGEAKLTLYSADGRKVLEETIQGKGTWTPSPPSSQPSGVYFARVEGGASYQTKKVVLVK